MCELLRVFHTRVNLERTSAFLLHMSELLLMYSTALCRKDAVRDRRSSLASLQRGDRPLRHLKGTGNLQHSPGNHFVRG